MTDIAHQVRAARDSAADPPSDRGPRPSGQDRSFGGALHRLRAAQKPAKGAPAYSRYINRKLGRVFAAIAYRLGLTPNVVTAISAVFSFSAIALLALAAPSVPVAVGVTLGLVLGYALDAADGQLARLRGGGSVSGEWLDHMIDATKISSLHLAVLISAYRFFDLSSDAWLLVPIGFVVVANVAFFGFILNDQLRRAHGGAAATPAASAEPASAEPASALRSLLVLPTDYGLLCVIFVLLFSPSVFLGAYTVLFAGSAGYLALAVVKWFRVMKGLDVRPSVETTATPAARPTQPRDPS